MEIIKEREDTTEKNKIRIKKGKVKRKEERGEAKRKTFLKREIK